MAGVLPGLQAPAPTAELPAWLSYTSSATATTNRVYTFATFLANGAATLATTAVVETEYGTDILQLPVTVAASAVDGQQLGLYFTTAGGSASVTVVGVLGETRQVTLGPTSFAVLAATSTAAAAPTLQASTTQSATSAAASQGPIESSTSASAPSTPSSSIATSSAQALPPSSSSTSFPSSSSTSSAVRSTSSITSSGTTAGVSSVPFGTASSWSSNQGSSSTSSSSPVSGSTLLPVPSIRRPPNVNTLASGLTPSQLAAAIASPICFFFAVIAILFLCCCCIRRKRRKRVQKRALVEEEGLLDPGGAVEGIREKPQEDRVVSGGVLWELIPRRAPSRVSGRSGRSILSRLTGGLLGANGSSRSRSRSNRSGRTTTPRSSPLVGGTLFGASASQAGIGGASPNTGSHEGSSLLSPETAQSTAFSPQSNWTAYPTSATSPEMTFTGSPAVSALAAGATTAGAAREPTSVTSGQQLGEPFADIDLTSPRLDLGGFGPLPYTNEEEHLRHSPPPELPPIRPSGAFRLTKLYNADGTDAGVYLPPSPVSLGRQTLAPTAPSPGAQKRSSGPMGLLRKATVSLSEIWNGYETSTPMTDDGLATFPSPSQDGNNSRTNAPWFQHSSSDLLPRTTVSAAQTPPATPKSQRNLHSGAKESPAPRTPSPRRKQERILSEGGWLSGRVAAYMAGENAEAHEREEEGGIGGLRHRPGSTASSGETADLTRTPESTLFLNSSRWRGRSARLPSPPPFTSFDLVEDPPVAYDPPVDVATSPPPRPALATVQRNSQTTVSGSASLYSRQYSDSPPIPHALHSARSSLPSATSRVDIVGRAAKRHSAESGVRVLGRIAASFGALRSKRSNSSGWEHAETGNLTAWRRGGSGLRTREISTESMTDPFQRRFVPSLLPPPPSVSSPPPASTIKTMPGSSSSHLRHSTSQPSLPSPLHYSPSEPFSSSFRVSRPGSVHEGRRYLDPFEDVSETDQV
ncbi:hypothetical protein JCM10908_005431 [Rhodotorula pacifica]|uniref:uncharacterized protein n=1 Tax=Rhodotorula pacifica TaxID=1495444 RepID=UPI00316B8839